MLLEKYGDKIFTLKGLRWAFENHLLPDEPTIRKKFLGGTQAFRELSAKEFQLQCHKKKEFEGKVNAHFNTLADSVLTCPEARAKEYGSYALLKNFLDINDTHAVEISRKKTDLIIEYILGNCRQSTTIADIELAALELGIFDSIWPMDEVVSTFSISTFV